MREILKEVSEVRSKVLDEQVPIEWSEAMLQLFESLRKNDGRVVEFLINDFQGLPVSAELAEWAYNYFLSHSVITAATVANRGSSVTTEFLYDGLLSPSPIDNYFLQAKAGKAVKARLIAIEKVLPQVIEEYRNKASNILIGNLGSGPGRDVIDILSYRYRYARNIKAIHIDKDRKALERGRIMARNKGVSHLVEFVEADFLRYKVTEKFDIVLLIGILCPLEKETCVSCLRIIKRLLKNDSCLIVSNASKRMQKEDPFTCYIMEWTSDWKLVYKDENEVEQIYREAGYTWKGYFTDEYGFHIMGMGTPIVEP